MDREWVEIRDNILNDVALKFGSYGALRGAELSVETSHDVIVNRCTSRNTVDILLHMDMDIEDASSQVLRHMAETAANHFRRCSNIEESLKQASGMASSGLYQDDMKYFSNVGVIHITICLVSLNVKSVGTRSLSIEYKVNYADVDKGITTYNYIGIVSPPEAPVT